MSREDYSNENVLCFSGPHVVRTSSSCLARRVRYLFRKNQWLGRADFDEVPCREVGHGVADTLLDERVEWRLTRKPWWHCTF